MRWVLCVIFALIAIVIGVVYFLNRFYIYRDVISPLERAQVAAQSESMLGYISQTTRELEKRGWDHGSTAFVFTSPTNDLGLVHQSLVELEGRLLVLNEMDKSSQQYQSGMDDVRGIVRELRGEEGVTSHLNAPALLWKLGEGAWMTLVAWLLGIIAFCFGAWAVNDPDH